MVAEDVPEVRVTACRSWSAGPDGVDATTDPTSERLPCHHARWVERRTSG